MADAQPHQQQAQARMQAPFPTPPPFYQHFTKQNVAKLRQLRKEAGIPPAEPTSSNGLDVAALPAELRYLLPPPVPADGKWRSFGREHALDAPDPSLSDLDIEQLYPDQPAVKLNPQQHLIALSRSLLTTFLSLVGQMSQDPTMFEGHTKDLETIVFNMHDLINQYRPHQARETFILLMEERIEKLRGETRAIREAEGKVKELLEELGREKSDAGGETMAHILPTESQVGEKKATEARVSKQRAAWAALSGAVEEDGSHGEDTR